MKDSKTILQEANKCRKEGNYKEAVKLYKSQWRSSNDIYSGTGYLHCLRKTNEIEAAIKLAEELMNYDITMDWTRNEILWLYITNVFKNDSSNIPLHEANSTALRLLNLKPDKFQNECIVFWILKISNKHKAWELINDWVNNVNYDELSSKPSMINGKEGWSKKAIWYHYRVKGIIFTDVFDRDTFNKFMDEALIYFPKQKKFFLRLKAIYFERQGEFEEAEKIFKYLCNSNHVDWWIIYDYAKFKIKIGEKTDALYLMYKAVNERGKLDSKVKVIRDISMLCEEFQQYENAYLNYLLYKYIREKNNWNVEKSIYDKISELQETYSFDIAIDYSNVYKKCINAWLNADRCGDSITINDNNQIGYVLLGREEKKYCFIKLKHKDSVFCMKSDLPNGVKNGSKVAFEVIPSYDKKKGIESVKAINIRIVE